MQDNKSPQGDLSKKAWHVVGIIAACFVSGFFGAWVFAASGVVNLGSIERNRETLVLQEGEVISEIFNKVSPSTVTITTEQIGSDSYYGQYVNQGSGSGIIISKDGYILTNKHVVADVDVVTITLDDGTRYENARVIARDPVNDIAFIKIDGVDNLVPAELGVSGDVVPGQKVVAIGNALGEFSNSVTSGIISGIGRPIEAANDLGSAEKLENLLQTDAAINPGNSGGPLVNLQGQVVGINTAISAEGEGLGFAIPIDDAKNMIESVLREGKIVKPYLGVRYVVINNEIASSLGLDVTSGALIVGSEGAHAVLPGSPADKAGLKEDDVVLKIGSEEISEGKGLATIISRFKPGDEIELTIVRAGQEQKIKVILEEFNQ